MINTNITDTTQQVVNDMGSLRNLRNTAQKDESKGLKEAAKAFEGLFLQMMLKEARATKWSNGFAEGVAGTAGAMDKYTEWRDDQLSQNLSAKGSVGIADMLLKQLTPKHQQKSGSQVDGVDFSGDVNEMSKLARQYFDPVTAPIGGMASARPLPNQLEALDRISTDTGVGMPTAADTVMLRNLLLGRK
jgi:Rod binding domain-containing protein